MLTKKAIGGLGGVVRMKVWFSGHHGEPPFELEHRLRLSGKGAYTHYMLTLSPSGDFWEVEYPDEAEGEPAAAPPPRRPHSAR